MTDHSPESLSDIEILDILQSMKDDELDRRQKKRFLRVVKRVVKKHIKLAIVALNQSFEVSLLKL